jgi:hypothetical protein
MSNEIKDNENIHSDKEIYHDNGEQSQEIDQPSPLLENEQIKEISTNDTQLSLSIDNDSDIPSEIPSTDVVIEEEEEAPTAIITSEEISLAVPTSDEDTNTPVDTIPIEENSTTVDTDQSESSNQSDDTHKLLKIIADKSNKEASSTILNTVRSTI